MAGTSSSVDREWVVDLENHGIDGSNKLRQLLTTCADPIETIKHFQENNSVKLPTLKSAMKLLDLHNVRRSDYHEMAINDLTERMLGKLRALGADGSKESQRKLEMQLEKSFKLYRVPKIRPIVLETLKQLPKVSDRYLKIIVADKDFYNQCAVSVRQQIWIKNDALYLEAITPVIDTYINEKQKILLTVDQMPTNFFTCETTKARRQWPQIQELMSMVGEREALYERLTEVIRERFVQTGDVKYCTLRMELIMAAHDLNVDSIVRVDVCHDLAWCLDACVRDKHLDAQQTNKLKNLLDSLKKSTPESIGDMAMIAGDVHVVHFLSAMCVKVLRDTATGSGGGHLPRELSSLQLLFRLLTLGASAHQILSMKKPSALQAVDALVFTKFLSSMMSLVVEDVIRAELTRAPDEVADDSPAADFLSEPSEAVLNFLKTDVSCSLIWIHYVLEMLPSKRRAADAAGIIRYLRVLPRLKDRMAFRDPWTHLVVHRVVQSTPFENLLSNEEAAVAFVDDFLMSGLDVSATVKYHLLRILHLLGSLLGEFRTRSLLEKIAPENVFEPGAIEDEEDVKRYTAEYKRVQGKLMEKASSSMEGTAAAAVPLSPVTPLHPIDVTPPGS